MTLQLKHRPNTRLLVKEFMITKTLRLNETSSFLVEWIKAPLRTASIIPSSEQLAKKMVKGLSADSGPVIELGPGTGVFTRELLHAGVAEADLTLVELNRNFAYRLKSRYPQSRVFNARAEQLHKLKLAPAGAVVSGLPFLSMRDQIVDEILDGAFKALKSDGVFIQFTYGHRCPVKSHLLQKHGLVAERSSFVLNNFPPASVYHIRRHHSYPF